MTFCNLAPIAKACYLGKEIVEDAINALIESMKYLGTQGISILNRILIKP